MATKKYKRADYCGLPSSLGRRDSRRKRENRRTGEARPHQ